MVVRGGVNRLQTATRMQATPTPFGDRIRTVGHLAMYQAQVSLPLAGHHRTGPLLDPRDKIYPLLGFTPKAFADDVVPAYSAPVAEVYREAFLSYLCGSDSLALLC
jgi:hypothetical protein